MGALPGQLDSDFDEVENASATDENVDAYLKALGSAISNLAEQEQQRVSVQREIALLGIEAAERAEQRNFDLSLKQIESEDAQHGRRYGLGRLVVIFVGIAFLAALLLAGLVIAMAFFGSESQTETALTILSYGVAAVAGGGAVLFVVYFVNILSRWWQRM